MLQFSSFYVLFWAILILVAWVGWGFLLSLILRPNCRVSGWGLMAAWGMAVYIALGGLLNLFALISPAVVLGFVVVGFVACIGRAIGALAHYADKRAAVAFSAHVPYLLVMILLIGCGALRLVQIAFNVPDMNGHDDFHAYYVFPLRMLQAGWLAPDPFNVTQMGTLGGQSLLQVLVLAPLGLAYIDLLDRGLCLIVCAALIVGYQQEQRAGALTTLLSAGLPFLAVSALEAANSSAEISAIALYIALFRTLDWYSRTRSARPDGGACIVALVAAAMITLKSIAIPYAVLLLAASCVALIVFQSDRQASVKSVIGIAAATGMVLLPWMIAMHLSFGTLLYPFLGQGYSGRAYGSYPVWSDFTRLDDLQPDSWLAIATGLALVYVCAFRLTSAERVASLCLLVATIGGTLAMLWATAGYLRYTFPFTVGASMIFATDVSRQIDRLSGWKGVGALLLGAAIAISAPWVLPRVKTVAELPEASSLLQRTKIFAALDLDGEVIRRAQGAVAEGETIVAEITRPFLLNFSRNKVYVVAWAHGSSLPPGMPLGKGSETLAEYFLSVSIRYVLYEHANPGFWYPGGDPRCRDAASAGPVLSRRGGSRSFEAYECSKDLSIADFVRNLDRLMVTREPIYTDGRFAVIDLGKRR